MSKYGYTGSVPSQSSGSNTGVFSTTDIDKLLKAGQWTLQTVDVDYLVIAGGGGGGGNNNVAPGGGGGAGGYRASYNSETSGGGGSSETTLTLLSGTSFTVTVGAGGTRATTGTGYSASGSNSVFSI